MVAHQVKASSKVAMPWPTPGKHNASTPRFILGEIFLSLHSVREKAETL